MDAARTNAFGSGASYNEQGRMARMTLEKLMRRVCTCSGVRAVVDACRLS